VSLEQILQDREADYGQFSMLAKLSQNLKEVVQRQYNWAEMPSNHKESIEMILHKISRLINGNSHKADTWLDIAGYATLVASTIMKDNK
jgi:hypothetical protein